MNKRNLGNVAITFDVDWAPDWAVRECYELASEHGIKSTFFITHPSPLTAMMAKDEAVELGIHPNFLANSTQRSPKDEGETYTSVLDYLTTLIVAPKSMRTHSLYRCSRLYALIEESYRTIENDVSFFAFFNPEMPPFFAWHSNLMRPLVHIPFHFEDDFACSLPKFDFKAFISKCETNPGPTVVFNFHPIHIALNSKDLKSYSELKKRRFIPSCSKSDVDELKNQAFGMRDLLVDLLDNSCHTWTISEIGAQFRERNIFEF